MGIIIALITQVILYSFFLAAAALFVGFFASAAGALFALAKTLIVGVSDNHEIIVKYPIIQVPREGVSRDFNDKLRAAAMASEDRKSVV